MVDSPTNLVKRSMVTLSLRKVLIVDDDPFNVFTLEKLLERLNIPTSSAYNGIRAIEMLEEHLEGYGLILMDCNMPMMDGIEVHFYKMLLVLDYQKD